MKTIRLFLLLLAAPVWCAAQGILTTSSLPIVVIDTGGKPIVDTPRTEAHLGIIDNGPGRMNGIGDPYNGYDGHIAIEIRGSSSQMFPKKGYGFETRTEDGANNNVSLLDLPRENDWILHGPYSDKSLIRNVLAYTLARRMGRYASRSALCELVVNGDYRGIYVLLEKIKRDRFRVNIADLPPDIVDGDDLTGGYIIKVDKTAGDKVEGWQSTIPPYAGAWQRTLYQYHFPKPGDINDEQKEYIRGVIDAFEAHMSRAELAGYEALIDVDSFVDYILHTELTRNVDGYRLSAFLYKDRDSRDPRLVAGPVWDVNLGFGNADYYGGSRIEGWHIDFREPSDGSQVPFWWRRLFNDETVERRLAERWVELRDGPFHLDSIRTIIDTQVALLSPATSRNFSRWPVLGIWVWPNEFVGATWESEIDYLKQWIERRVVWLDTMLARKGTGSDLPLSDDPLDVQLYPNPTGRQVTIQYFLLGSARVRIDIYDMLGRPVAVLEDRDRIPGEHRLSADIQHVPPGIYFLHIRVGNWRSTETLVRL